MKAKHIIAPALLIIGFFCMGASIVVISATGSVLISMTLCMGGVFIVFAGVLFIVWNRHNENKKTPQQQQFPNDVIINGVHYPKAAFQHVDICVRGQEKIFAIKEVREITGLGLEEAKEVVDHWKKYY